MTGAITNAARSTGQPTIFACKRADQIFIGSRKTDWDVGLGAVRLRFDVHSIWVVRTDGKEMHLARDYSQDVFRRPECTAEVHRHWMRQFEGITRPSTVPPEAVRVPMGPAPLLPLFSRTGPHFWVSCRFDPQSNWDVCDIWGEKGVKYHPLECVNVEDHRAVVQKDLVVDPLTTKMYDEIHLQNGVVLKDWAKGRTNYVCRFS